MKFSIGAGGLLAAAVLVLGGGAGAAAAQSTPPVPLASGGASAPGQPISDQDRTFMIQNAEVGLAEIDAGQLAAQRATPEIRQTAQTIVNDHQQALAQLRSLAQRYSVTLPEAPNSTQQQQAAQLQSLNGPGFDRTYLQLQIAGHEQAIAGTQQEISAGTNPDVQQYARTILPVLQKHLQMVQTAAQQLGAAPPPPSGGVNAGAGGAAAPWASAGLVGALLGGGSLLVAAAVALLLLIRRRQA
jgi:putative membrane protein